MGKQIIRLTESDLHRIIEESVKNVLNEIGDTPRGQYALGALAGRNFQRGQQARANGDMAAYQNYSDKRDEIYNKLSSERHKVKGIDADAQNKRIDMSNAENSGWQYGMRKGQQEM